MQAKRLFNNRPICFFALFLTLGMIFGECFAGVNPLFRIIPLLISITLSVMFFCFRKLRKAAYMPLALLVGLLAIFGYNDIYISNAIEPYEGDFQARVASEIVVSEDKTSFYIDDIYADGKRLKGKAYLILYSDGAPDYGAGDTIKINGALTFNGHAAFDNYYAYNSARNINYFAVAQALEKTADGDVGFPLKLQLKIKRLFYENTDEYTASVCQALLLGDKRGMDADLYEDVKTSGLAHVLAVSGLHITAVSAGLFFLLKKIRVNPKIAFAAATAVTFLYVMLCSFTPSALRAFIMSTVFALADISGLKKDGLSALAFACIVILLVNPISFADAGYILSVFSVLGLFMFYKSFGSVGKRAVGRISPKKGRGARFADVCSASVSANLMTAPFVAYFFGSLPVLFILSNFLILPYMMFIYIFLLIITVFALISTLSGTVGILGLMLIPFKEYVSFVGSISFASVSMPMAVGSIILIEIALVVLSRFLFVRKTVKWQIALLIFALAGVALLV